MPNNLKKIRESKGLTQKQLGKLINKTEVTISRYESQDQRLNLPLMRQLAKTLQCTVGQIAGEAEPQTGDVIDYVRLDSLIQKVLEISEKVSSKKKPLAPSQISQLVILYCKAGINISDDEIERSAELLTNANK